MNIRDKFISDNFNRCNDPSNKLTTSESKIIQQLSKRINLSQKEFNQLAQIADTSERRGMEERTFSTFKCK
jgi:DNA replication initiation complex subunit (GINS family)